MAKKSSFGFVPYSFLLPALIVLTVFFFVPMLNMFRLSASNYSPLTGAQFTGLANYRTLLIDPTFWRALWNTCLYTILTVPGLTVLGFFLALLVNTKVRGVNAFRTFYYIPVVTSMVIVGVVWKWMFQSDGLLNNMLGLVHILPLPWLTSTRAALPSVSLVTLWKSTAYYMVIYLAGLQTLDRALYEVAMVDGATWWQQLRHITVPLMRPFTLVVASVGTINAFRVFGEVFVLTSGGPSGSTDVLTFYIYRMAFNYMKMGYASTLAVILLVIVMILSYLNFKFFAKGGRNADV